MTLLHTLLLFIIYFFRFNVNIYILTVENLYNQEYHKVSHPRVKLCHFAGLHEDLLDFAFSGNSISSFPTNEISCNISKEHNVHEHYLSYDQQQNNYKYVLDVQGFR